MKKRFFSTDVGKLGAAAILIMLSLPVIVLSLNSGFASGSGIGLGMICAGMAFPPLKFFLGKR